MRYLFLLLSILLFSACSWTETRKETVTYYPVSGISTYQGQGVASLFDANGAPNAVRHLKNGDIVWIYYTNYRPVGGSEMISYTSVPGGVTCKVMVLIRQDKVAQVTQEGC